MSRSDPWLKLGIDYAALFIMLSNPSREVYVATWGEALLGVIVF